LGGADPRQGAKVIKKRQDAALLLGGAGGGENWGKSGIDVKGGIKIREKLLRN